MKVIFQPAHRAATAGLTKVGPPGGHWYRMDVLACAVGLIAIVEHFRARAAYSSSPLFAMILPALFCAGSPGYRRRLARWFLDGWSQLEVYSRKGGSVPWLAVGAFAVVPAWLMFLSNQRTLGAIDTRPVVPTAISLITEGNWELGEYFRSGARKVSLLDRDGQIPLCFQVRPGGIYSTYPAGMVPFTVAVTGLAMLADANLDNVEVHRHLEKMTASLVSAASIGLFFVIALRMATPGPAWVTTALLAMGSGIFSTASMGLWQHGGIIFWSLLILLLEFRQETISARWVAAIQGVACAQLVTCRLTSAAFLIPFSVWVLVRSPKRVLAIVGYAAIAYFPWGCTYWATYGNPFGPSTGVLSGGLWSVDLVGPMAAVLVSPGRGLLVYQPWILMTMAFALPSIRRRIGDRGFSSGPAGWVCFCLASIGFQVAMIAAWGCWWGGWSWGSRLLLEIVPLCALLCVPPIAALLGSRWGRTLVISMALFGIMAQVPAVYFHAGRWNATARFPDDVWSWFHPPFVDWYLGP